MQNTKRGINEPNTLNLEELRLQIVGHLTFGIENSPKNVQLKELIPENLLFEPCRKRIK